MPTSADPHKREQSPPSQQHDDLKQACLSLVQDMSEPLTAITNYLEAASRLHLADTTSARTQLGEIIEKSLSEVRHADEILRKMRDLVRQK